MTSAHRTVKTAYGLVDEEALDDLQETFDTRTLLALVDDLDSLVDLIRSEDGLRDELMRLHGMIHTVLNGVGLSVMAGEDTLPDVVVDSLTSIRSMRSTMNAWILALEPLEKLVPKT